MSPVRLLAFTLVPAWGYALVRYVGVGSTPWSQVPLWVTNKALGVAALALGVISQVAGRQDTRQRAGRVARRMALLHGLVSLALLRPAAYPKCFDAMGSLSPAGQFSFLAAAAALVLCLGPSRREGEPPRGIAFSWVLGLVAVHTAALGLPGWLNPAVWPGHLPPLTLVGFLLTGIPLARMALQRWVGTPRVSFLAEPQG